MGQNLSADKLPADEKECGLDKTFKNVHWVRGKRFWPGTWCYDGDVCAAGRIRALNGDVITFHGPGSCKQAGFDQPAGYENKFGGEGKWSQGHPLPMALRWF